jgi:tetratricopeptide (TPR) repeat protein
MSSILDSLALRREIGDAAGVAESLIALGDLQRRAGEVEAACGTLDEAVELLQDQGRRAEEALALALRCDLPGGDVTAAEDALRTAGDNEHSHRGWWMLWQATRDPAHLDQARRLLDEVLASAPPECREEMVVNVRVNREILAAWREEFGEDDDSTGGGSPTESPTRAG